MKTEETPPKISRLMQAIEIIEAETVTKSLTLGDLVVLLGDMGNGILIILFCLVFMQPIPFPGISTPIAVVIVILATLQYLHKSPKIPKRLSSYVIPQKALHKTSEVARKLWSKIERFLHPRMLYLVRAPFFRLVNLVIVIASAVFLSLPLPIPLSNTIPAIVILLFTFAQLEDDGGLVVAGYFMGLVMLGFFIWLGAGMWSFAGNH